MAASRTVVLVLALGCAAEPGEDPLDESSTDAAASSEGSDDGAAFDDGAGDDDGDDDDGEPPPDDPPGDPTAPPVDDTTGADEDPAPPPTGADELLPWLQAGGYLPWAAESGVHASSGPHFGGVRTFVNAPLLASLASGASEHPVDSASVKELYGDGGEVVGWSVMIKVAAGGGGDTWYWLEQFGDSRYADSVGAGICTGCHTDGIDFFLSPFPLQ